MIIWGHDPGERNYGYTVLEYKKDGVSFRILEIGQILNTVTNLTDKPMRPPKSRRKKEDNAPPLVEGVQNYRVLLKRLAVEHGNPAEVYSERFQTRGVKSRSVETVSFMNGILCLQTTAWKASFHTMIAGTWKNAFNRNQSLDRMYELGKTLGLTPHEIDSFCIALTRGGKQPPPAFKVMKQHLKKYTTTT